MPRCFWIDQIFCPSSVPELLDSAMRFDGCSPFTYFGSGLSVYPEQTLPAEEERFCYCCCCVSIYYVLSILNAAFVQIEAL